MLEDLPTLQRLDLYQEVETTDFLDKLQKGRLFDDVPESGHPVADAKPVVSNSLTDRHKQVVKMSKIERDRLQRNLIAFQQMNAESQGRYRTLNDHLEEDRKAGGHLSSLLQTYSAWLQTLTPSQREELRQGTDSANKLALVHKFKEEQYHRVDPTPAEATTLEPSRPFPGGPRPLSQSDLNNVMKVLVAELPTDDQEKFGRLNSPEQYVDLLRRNIQSAPNPRSWPSAELQDKILAVLPNQDRTFIKRNQTNQRVAIVRLINRSIFDIIRQKLPKESDFNQTLDELDDKQRAALEKKNPDEKRRELIKRYLQKHDSKTLKQLDDLNHMMSETGAADLPPPRGMDDRARSGEPPGPPPRDGRPPERPRRDAPRKTND